MMSEYYDQYHRWEPLAEFHFNVDGEEDIYEDENYIYCLCSRAFIRYVKMKLTIKNQYIVCYEL